MEPSCAVLIPVLARPHRVEPLLTNILASERGHPLEPVFIANHDDAEEIAAIRAAGLTPMIVAWPVGTQGDWARKLNHAYRVYRRLHDWSLFAADDLDFHAGWFEQALSIHDRTGACVIGTNDLGNSRVISGRHSTHTLFHADYLDCGTIDEAGLVLHESYYHNFADDEVVQTAKFRGAWAFSRDSLIAHLHPDWGKGDWDSTYELSRAHFEDDRIHYESRNHLWGYRSAWER